jgi:hypothetical protein
MAKTDFCGFSAKFVKISDVSGFSKRFGGIKTNNLSEPFPAGS